MPLDGPGSRILLPPCLLALHSVHQANAAVENLGNALAMARNGMDFHAAWKHCSKLPGGATSWGNAQRTWRAAADGGGSAAGQHGKQQAVRLVGLSLLQLTLEVALSKST